MLILSRRIGQRVRITTPDGYMWITMGSGFATVMHTGDDLHQWQVSRHSAPLIIGFGPEDGLEQVAIVFKPRRLPRHNDMVGIQAPDGWLILREELIDKAKDGRYT
jgi:hypothetical protein